MNTATVCGMTLFVAIPAAASAGTSTPAPAIAPDFNIVREHQPLPRHCVPSFVARRMAGVLGAFNAGRLVAFTSRFAEKAEFAPYDGRPQGRYSAIGRAAIASVVRRRHQAGDGWTAYQLVAPVGVLRGQGIFGLFLRVRVDDTAFEQGVKVVISCNTGKILAWRGPAWKPQA
jgi:hypothetical protein